MMEMKKDCSGREKTLKRSLRKAGSIQELKALVKEARRTAIDTTASTRLVAAQPRIWSGFWGPAGVAKCCQIFIFG